MPDSPYLVHLRNQNERSFMKTMDFGYALQEAYENVNKLNVDLDIINQQINNIQQQLKKASPESKASMVSQMKDLGVQKNAIKNEINDKLDDINHPDGLRAKISRLGADQMFKKVDQNSGGFVDYLYTIAITTPELQNRFIEAMSRNYEQPYVSNYGKELSKKSMLDERSGNIYERVSSLPSFKNKNSNIVNKTLQIDLIDDQIQSYLKRKNGGKSKRIMKKKSRKTRRNRKSRTTKKR
jgi:hypothetical protein